jgi:hypothetical protein
MRGCVKAVLLLSLFLSLDLAADCVWTPRHSFHFRTTALDLSVDGDFVWLATSYGVQLLDGIEVVDAVALPGATRVVAADGNGFAYAGSGANVHVLRRDGRTITRVAAVAAPGEVNDLELAAGHLFAATSNGIAHYQLFDRSNPVRTNVSLPTSSPNVTALAIASTTLYAADGDATVEVFGISSPATPIAAGVLNAMPLATSVHADGDVVLVSDRFGRSTDVFRGFDRIRTLPYGSNSFAATNTGARFVAGPDRTIRAVNLAAAEPVIEYFEAQLAPTGGTDNAIHDLARAGETLYIAAGDMGLSVLDLRALGAPWPHVSYGTGGTTTVRTAGNKAFFANFGGSISERRVDPSGIALVHERTWEAGPGSVVADVVEPGLLTVNGASVTLWSLTSTAPAAAFIVQLPEAVVDAVMGNAHIVAVLANGAVYTFVNAQSAPQKVNVPKMTHVARFGSAIAMTEVQESTGKTVVHYWPAGDLATPARTTTIDGAAVGNVALNATRAAIFTFTGFNVIDLASGAVQTIANTHGVIPRQLAFAGNDLLVLDSRRLYVYENAGTFVREQPLAADATAMDVAGGVVVLATNEGVAAVSRTTSLPHIATGYANSYYTKVVLDRDRAFLFSRNGIDVFSTSGSSPLRLITNIRAQGAIDLAASDGRLFTLSGNGTISTWSPFGALLAETMLNEGADAVPISIAAVNGRAWVSLSTGCTTSACTYKTVVTNADGTGIESSMSGELLDVTATATTAWALFDNPREIRVLSLANPGSPAQTAVAAAPAGASSLAREGTRIHVLADTLRSYSDTNLTFDTQRLTAVPPDDSHRIRIDGGCALLTGRTEQPELYRVPGWNARPSPEVPSNVRSVAIENGLVLLLTGHSLEIWSNREEVPVKRRRSVR